RQGVDAVALPGGRGAVVEDVAEVAAAALAQHLDAGHEVALVDTALDVRLVLGLPEARPARTGVELRARREQDGAAAGAAVGAVVVVVDELAGEGRLGARLAQHLVLGRRELAAPLLVGLADFRTHRASVVGSDRREWSR